MRRPRRAMAEINVVPYIDVMLVLLIIFMVAAPLINPGQIDRGRRNRRSRRRHHGRLVRQWLNPRGEKNLGGRL